MRFAVHYLFVPTVLLTRGAASLNITVQVIVSPQVTGLAGLLLPLCAELPLLDLFQPLLTSWVTQATLPYIPDFQMPGGLVLTYHKNVRRMLRASNDSFDSRSLTTAKKTTPKLTAIAPCPCVTCSSAGCATYCGNAVCSLCSSSRRLEELETDLPIHHHSVQLAPSDAESSVHSNNQKDNDVDEAQENIERSLGSSSAVNFTTLGTLVSATVQGLLQDLLLNQVLDILGCLGDPLLLSTQVTFSVHG